MGRPCSKHEGTRNACKILVGKLHGKRPLRSFKYRWEDDIKMVQKNVNI